MTVRNAGAARGGLRPLTCFWATATGTYCQTTGTQPRFPVLNAGDGEYVLSFTADPSHNYEASLPSGCKSLAQKYRETGGSNSFLGAPPITRTEYTRWGRPLPPLCGRLNLLHPTTRCFHRDPAGSHPQSLITTPCRNRGFLGYPVSDGNLNADGAGRLPATFQGRLIYWHLARALGSPRRHPGQMDQAWARNGFLGYPSATKKIRRIRKDGSASSKAKKEASISCGRGEAVVEEPKRARSSQSSPSTNMETPRFVTAPDYPTPRPRLRPAQPSSALRS